MLWSSIVVARKPLSWRYVWELLLTASLFFQVLDGVGVFASLDSVPIAGQSIDERIHEILLSHGTFVGHGQSAKPLKDLFARECPPELIAKFKTYLCEDVLPEDLIQVRFDNGAVAVPGSALRGAIDVLFDDDEDEQSIPSLLLSVLLKAGCHFQSFRR